jgi:hypothetical protein
MERKVSKVLLGTVVVSNRKDYAVPTFERMCQQFLTELDFDGQVDVLAIVDQAGSSAIKKIPKICKDEFGTHFYSGDICYHGKHLYLREYALEHGYDTLIWQGIDCFYDSRQDFERLLNLSKKFDYVGAVVAGRGRPDYPVCRIFKKDGDNITEAQEELPPHILRESNAPLQVCGYIGSDATALSRDALETIKVNGYVPWHQRKKNAETNPLDFEEYYTYCCISRYNLIPVVDPTNRPWHAHDNGDTVRYPDGRIRLSELDWDENGKRIT